MCSVPGIPERLHQKERLPDSAYLEDELLFRRYRVVDRPEDWEDNTDIHVSLFPLNNDSYNRSKYSQASDVLLNINAVTESEHYSHWGILSVKHADLVRKEFTIEVEKEERGYMFQPQHSPVDCMYPHLELLVFSRETGQQVPKKPQTIKSGMRRYLVNQKIILKQYES